MNESVFCYKHYSFTYHGLPIVDIRQEIELFLTNIYSFAIYDPEWSKRNLIQMNQNEC